MPLTFWVKGRSFGSARVVGFGRKEWITKDYWEKKKDYWETNTALDKFMVIFVMTDP